MSAREIVFGMKYHQIVVVKQFTDIPINRGPFKEKNRNRFEFYRTGISAMSSH